MLSLLLSSLVSSRSPILMEQICILIHSEHSEQQQIIHGCLNLSTWGTTVSHELDFLHGLVEEMDAARAFVEEDWRESIEVEPLHEPDGVYFRRVNAPMTPTLERSTDSGG